MLMKSGINPFDSQETKPYKNDSEILAMTNLVRYVPWKCCVCVAEIPPTFLNFFIPPKYSEDLDCGHHVFAV